LDGYWGVGSAGFTYPSNAQASLLFPANLLLGQTPLYSIFTRGNVSVTNFSMALANPLTYVSDSGGAGGTRTVHAVLLADASPGFVKAVFFSPSQIAVQWQWSTTAYPSGVTSTNNYLYLTDNFGEAAALSLTTNGAAGPRPTYRPANYNFVQANTPFAPGTGSSPVLPPSDIFGTDTATNQYSAYEALFANSTRLAGDVAGGNVTNMPGRIELTADTTLNLNEARISALSYLLLSATNQFLGSSNAQISAPNLDILLRTTNSSMSISNLVTPYMNHLSGTIELWSARWTNTATGTNISYHVLFVRSALSPVSRPVVQTLNLNATNSFGAATNNLFLSDVLTVSSNLVLNAENITITTNADNMFAPVGQLNYLNPAILWTTNLMPRLQSLTNWGVLSMLNQVYFSRVNGPLAALVNHGSVGNQGSFIQAGYFENSGVWDAGVGSINLEPASIAVLSGGQLLAPNGEVNLGVGSLLASNSVTLSGGVLNLLVTNLIDDGSLAANSADAVTNQSFWTAANGINLPLLPPQASLLATTVSNSAVDYQFVVNQWAGADRGCVPSGFSNNAALGRLILEGSFGSVYQFVPVPLLLSFDDPAPPVPASPNLVPNGTYRPTNYTPTNSMPTNGVAQANRPPPPPYGTSLSRFSGAKPDGTWHLYMAERTTNGYANVIPWSWSLRAVTTNVVSITATNPLPPYQTYPTNLTVWFTNVFNSQPMALADGQVAAPYPSDISVPIGTTGYVWKVTATLSSPEQTFPEDIDALLVGPNTNVMLMAGAGTLDTNRNALYVDLLEFRDYVATNVDNRGNFSSVGCDPNMRVYFGQALANGKSIAEKLSLVNGGRFSWVSNYNAGVFSSTNLVYPDGTTHRLNTALVTSCDIDSNGNGIPNCMDPAPIPVPTPASLALTVAFTAQPAPAAQVSWTAFPGTVNTLYAASAPGSTQWTVVTNFLYSGPFPGRVLVTDSIKAHAPRFYRVSAGLP
jgi:hypothetical protein